MDLSPRMSHPLSTSAQILYKSTEIEDRWQVLTNSPLKVTVFGAGAFGTALATIAARAGHKVIILAREKATVDSINEHGINPVHFPAHRLHPSISATTDILTAMKECELIIHCIPVQATPSFLQSIQQHIPPHVPIISTSKGIVVETEELISTVLERIFPPSQPLCYLSGPSFAKEIMDGNPIAIVLASHSMQMAKSIQHALSSKFFRIYATTDVIGVEISGAIKNVFAIASGMLSGMRYGDSSIATMITRANEELRRLIIAMGGCQETASSLACIGDLMLTCFSPLSRNRTFGYTMTSLGLSVEETKAHLKINTIEGLATVKVAKNLAIKYDVDLPLLSALCDVIHSNKNPLEVLENIMTRPLGVEMKN